MNRHGVSICTCYLLLLALSILLIVHEVYIGRYFGDAAYSIELGLETVSKKFIVTHGKPSSTSSMLFPPGYAFFMGAVVLLFDYPHHMLMAIATITICGILLLAYTYRKYLSYPAALISLMAFALNPEVVADAQTMWELTPTLITSALALFFLTRFLTEKRTFDYVAGVSAMVIGCQFYFSVFYLMPGLILFSLIYCRTIGVKGFLLAFLCSLVISAPYFHYLFLEGGLLSDLAKANATLNPGRNEDLPIYLHLTDIFASIPSIRILFFWFHNRESVVGEYLGASGLYIVYAAMTFSLFFVMGMAKMVINGFLMVIGSSKREPIENIYIVSWLLIAVSIIILFLIKGPMTYYHPIAMLPFVAVITGVGAATFWRYLLWRVVTYAAVASHILLLIVMLVFPREDGYWRGNMASFQSQKQITESILSKTKKGERPSVIIDGIGLFSKAYTYLLYSMWKEEGTKDATADRYFAVRVAKDKIDHKIRWSITDITNDVDEYYKDISRLLPYIKPNEKVMVEGLYARHSFHWHTDEKRRQHHRTEGLKGTLQKKMGGLVDWDINAIKNGTPDVIAIAHKDPRIIEPNSLKYNFDHIREILSSGQYKVVKKFNTITLFRRGAPGAIDAKLVAQYLNTYQMTDLPGVPLAFYPHSDNAILTSNPKQNRFLSYSGEEKKNVIYGPYIDLDRGEYEVEFRIKTFACDINSNLYFDVSVDTGKQILQELQKDCSAFTAGNAGWKNVTLNFTIDEDGARNAEFRIYMSGDIVILGDYVRLTKLYES